MWIKKPIWQDLSHLTRPNADPRISSIIPWLNAYSNCISNPKHILEGAICISRRPIVILIFKYPNATRIHEDKMQSEPAIRILVRISRLMRNFNSYFTQLKWGLHPHILQINKKFESSFYIIKLGVAPLLSPN